MGDVVVGWRRFPGPAALRELERLRELVPDRVNSIKLSMGANQCPVVTLTLFVDDDLARVLSRALVADLDTTEGNGGSSG